MNINLIQGTKKYQFDINSEITIDYLLNLSSKIFNKLPGNILTLTYKKKLLNSLNKNLLLKDVITPNEKNIIIKVENKKEENINDFNNSNNNNNNLNNINEENKKIFSENSNNLKDTLNTFENNYNENIKKIKTFKNNYENLIKKFNNIFHNFNKNL